MQGLWRALKCGRFELADYYYYYEYKSKYSRYYRDDAFARYDDGDGDTEDATEASPNSA